MNDLKAFLYRFEERAQPKAGRRSQQLPPRGQKHREGAVESDGSTSGDARAFELTVNHRSHDGIVRCATAVVDLIRHWWPDAIDSMPPERGVVDGTKPCFFSGKFHRNTLHVRFHSCQGLTLTIFNLFNSNTFEMGLCRLLSRDLTDGGSYYNQRCTHGVRCSSM